MKHLLGNYQELIREFLDKGYRISFFDQLDGKERQLLLRHDVDFDCRLAYELSLIEDGLGIRSTWFFLLRSESYNPFSKENTDIIRSLVARGHRIGLHFDPSLYPDPIEGFREEKTLFETAFGGSLRIASIHRPNDFLKDCDAPICGVEHTYQDKFFRAITYVSDSQGRFRYGHPFETGAFRSGGSMHLLIHPVWWCFPDASDPADLLERFTGDRHARFRRHVAANCAPYREKEGSV